ncbi:AP2-like ethylene-responsive transcription factor At1g16060 [Macadamia integrifolia]|uniref:AP2-like ethylene-responsive transcription factor At1g16060 n=1 Tax=Macadamia integrifolia TaxID=60698 RepID=UPI001C4FB022|nr:AP2-like ethylene-responsive transcription factor At1g16060 [Macadamia integrifolia]
MAKGTVKTQKDPSNNNTTSATKVKRRRKSGPRESPPQRSSSFRGVTRHRWTGRYEAHLWDKNSWNDSQTKKGRQVYLGAYDDEEAAARAYDLAALKYWGQDTILNFPLLAYQEEIKEMEGLSREEYIGSLRRKSSGFSRGVSKYRGVARHHHNGRWEARIGRVFGNKYLYLGTYATQEEAAAAYDMAAIEYRGLNAVTNFDLSRYVKYLKPEAIDQNTTRSTTNNNSSPVDPTNPPNYNPNPNHSPNEQEVLTFLHQESPTGAAVAGGETVVTPPPPADSGGTANDYFDIGDLLLESTSTAESPSTTQESDPPRCTFPDDVQTYFDYQDSGSFGFTDDDMFFGVDLSSFVSQFVETEMGGGDNIFR